MINAIIIDDEPAARASLRLDIQLHCPQIRVVAEASSVATGIREIRQNQDTQLLFLDIQLTDGSGFDLLNNIDLEEMKVIFTTAYSEYALRAIKFAPLDYLLKPIDEDELKQAVEKVLKAQPVQVNEQIKLFMQQMNAGPSPARIALATADGMHLHYVKDIVRCASDGNYAMVHFTNGSKLLVAKTLKDMESLLAAYPFERIHKSHLINLDHLRRYYNRFTGEVEMSDGTLIPVAQRKKTALLELLNGLNR